MLSLVCSFKRITAQHKSKYIFLYISLDETCKISFQENRSGGLSSLINYITKRYNSWCGREGIRLDTLVMIIT